MWVEPASFWPCACFPRSGLKSCTLMSSLNPYRAVVCVVLLGAWGCRQQDTAIQRSEIYSRQANAYQAYWEIAEARQKNTGDRELERLFWQRRLEYLVDLGRELVFRDHEVRAITQLEKALALDPQNRTAKHWIARAKEKLAKRAVREGENQRSQGNLDKALLHFQTALSYVPEYPQAVAGIEKVNEYYGKRYDEATDHFTKGARARGEELIKQSKYHHGIAFEKDPSMREAEKRKIEATQWLARDRYEQGKMMEEKGLYGAALMQYEAVMKVLPGIEGLKERVAVMKKEVEATRIRREAEMAMRKDEFDTAKELLNRAYELTSAQRADISGLLLDNRQRRHQNLYRKARDQELEYKFEAALAGYQAIDKVWPSGFEDVKNRIETLENAIKLAGASMAEGQKREKAGDLKTAIEFYEEALANYPGYKGLDQRIKVLRAKVQNHPGG